MMTLLSFSEKKIKTNKSIGITTKMGVSTNRLSDNQPKKILLEQKK